MKIKQLRNTLFLCPLFLLISIICFGQDAAVSGKVTDEKGEVLPGVSISVKGVSKYTQSDAEGKYTINASPANTLVFSMIGFAPREITVGNQRTINVTLLVSSERLDEVVVVGYGTQRRRDLTGSISSVSGEVFKNQPITNAVEALQGRVAGVNVVKASGKPGESPSIVIRGISSLFQADPLYIVDGIRVNDVSSLNIQDIASMDVLKDAAAASIYGASAAGGVILITTKKGTSSTPSINYNTRYGVTTAKTGELLDKDGYLRLQSYLRPAIFANAPRLDTLANTDWINELFDNASEQNHNLSINGSTPQINYLISGFYNQQEGVLKRTFSNIGGARINSDLKLGKYFKFGEQVSISRRKTSNPQDVGVEAQLHNAPFRSLPIIPMYNKNGTYGTLPAGYPGLAYGGSHPVGSINNASVEDFRNNLQANIYGEVQLPLHLSIRSNIGYSYYNQNFNYFQNAFTIGGVGAASNALTKITVASQDLLANFLLNFNHSFSNHNISAVAGVEQITGQFNNVNIRANRVDQKAGEQYSFIQQSATTYQLSSNRDNNRLIQSAFARLNYNFLNKYYISGSVRQDANYTVFGPNKQKGVFPAVSASWNISDESFMKSAGVVSSLKLRGSYGQLGNSNVAPYSFLAVYQPFTALGNGTAGGQNFAPNEPLVLGRTYSAIPNPNLHWETTTESNIGLDGELLSNKLYFTAEFYNKSISDLLYQQPMAPSAGISGPYFTNIGSVRNRGFELLLGFRNKAGAFGYDVNFTGGWNKNELTKLTSNVSSEIVDGRNYYSNGDAGFAMMSNQTITVTRKGLPFGSFYGLKTTGIFQTDAAALAGKGHTVNGYQSRAGDLQFEDVDGNGMINDLDRQVIGNPNPKLVYGANIRLNFKGFDANFLFNGVAGVELFNGVKAYEMGVFADGNASPKVFGASFLGNNALTDQPRLTYVQANGNVLLDPNQNYRLVSSYFVEKGDYLKLKNLNVGYTFSNSLTQKLRIRSARFFVMGNNIFTITKYSGLDPELGASFSPTGYGAVTSRGIDVVSAYPQTKIYSAGLDITF